MTLVNSAIGGAWEQSDEQLPAVSTIDADILAFTEFFGVKYILHFKSAAQDVYRALEVMVSRVSGDDLSDAVYGIVGDYINVSVNVLKVGSDVKLEITNNETYTLDVRISRLITG